MIGLVPQLVLKSVEGNQCLFRFYISSRNSEGLYAGIRRRLPSPATSAQNVTQIQF